MSGSCLQQFGYKVRAGKHSGISQVLAINDIWGFWYDMEPVSTSLLLLSHTACACVCTCMCVLCRVGVECEVGWVLCLYCHALVGVPLACCQAELDPPLMSTKTYNIALRSPHSTSSQTALKRKQTVVQYGYFLLSYLFIYDVHFTVFNPPSPFLLCFSAPIERNNYTEME